MLSSAFSQDKLIENYNLLAAELHKAGFPIKILNEEGVCSGLSLCYFDHAKKKPT